MTAYVAASYALLIPSLRQFFRSYANRKVYYDIVAAMNYTPRQAATAYLKLNPICEGRH